MEITRGSLDEISRPTNTRQRPGSRVSLNSASSYRFNLNPSSSLEILPPEDISQEAHDIEVEEFSSGSDEEDNTRHDHQVLLRLEDSASKHSSAAPENTGNDNETDNINGDPAETDSNEGVDPKIAEAMRKMRQLDRILAKRVKREKEVKKQRIELHRQLQRELDGVKPEGRDEQKEIVDNTNKFLALVPPSSHNEGVNLEEDESPRTPVFATQPLDTDGVRAGQHQGVAGNDTNRDSIDGDSTNRSEPGSNDGANTRNGKKGSKKNRKNKNSKHGPNSDGKEDFIRRNIELATDAGNVIAMTDDEKKRLEDLLKEVEMLNEEEQQMPNPYQLQLAPGIGYLPDADEQRMLKDIDSKLMALMPSKEFMSICSTPIQGSSISGFGDISQEMFDLGEKVLQDNKQTRVQQERLDLIENELERMSNTVEQEMKSPRISNERLNELLRQCDDLSSRATSATSDYIKSSNTSPRSHSEHTPTEVPKLSEDILKHLLDEAKEAGITSTRSTDTRRSLSTVNEGEEDVESPATTGRSSQAGALVPYEMIQELLKNPRARSAASTDNTLAIEYPSGAGQESPMDNGSRLTSVSPGDDDTRPDMSPQSRLGKLTYENETLSRMGGASRHMEDQSALYWNRGSSNGHFSSHSVEFANESEEFTRSEKLDQNLLDVENANTALPHLPKSRGKSRIAFAAKSETYSHQQASTDSDKLLSYSHGEMTRPFRMPTPPQESNYSPSPTSKTPSSSRYKKTKSRSSSRGKSPLVTLSSSYGNRQDDLRLESVSASASFSTITDRTDSRASSNTSVSSSDFEYENDDEVQQQLLRVTPGDEDLSRRLVVARLQEDRDTPETQYYRPQPKVNRGIEGNKPVNLPVDKIHGIDSYAKSDDDSDKPFSPVFF